MKTKIKTVDVFRVEIECEAIESPLGSEMVESLITRFHRWCIKARILPVRGTSGGSAWSTAADFQIADKPRILEWLTEAAETWEIDLRNGRKVKGPW